MKKKGTEKILRKSIKYAKAWMALSDDPAHDIQHTKSVLETALLISRELGYKNTLLIEVICWWHDVGRLFSPIHEELSAQIAKYNLLGLGCDEKTVETVYQAIRFHKWKMEPTTVEGNILRDADKLDFISVNRWKQCLEQNQPNHLIPMGKLIPKLRIILKLDPSKSIYDLRIKKFIRFINRRNIQIFGVP